MELIDRRKLVSDFWKGVEDASILSYEDTDDLMENAPTVDAVVLPCKIGTQIWLTEWHCSGMRWTKLIEPKPRTVHHFDITKDGVFAHFRDGCINVKYFGESVFLTKEEAKATLAKMDGGKDND